MGREILGLLMLVSAESRVLGEYSQYRKRNLKLTDARVR